MCETSHDEKNENKMNLVFNVEKREWGQQTRDKSSKTKLKKKSWCLQLTPDIGSKSINKENDMMITTQ